MRQGLACLRPAGTLVALGLNSADAAMTVPINDLVQRQKRIVGALYGSSNPRIDLPRIFALYRVGRLPLGELLGARRPLSEVNEAYAELRRGSVGRTVLARSAAAVCAAQPAKACCGAPRRPASNRKTAPASCCSDGSRP